MLIYNRIMRTVTVGIVSVSFFMSCLVVVDAQNTPEITQIVWSNRGDLLALGYTDGRLELTSDEGTILQSLTEHTTSISNIAWSPDDSELFSAGNNEAYIWNLETGEITVDLQEIYGKVLSGDGGSWNQDGSQIIVWTTGNRRRIAWETENYTLIPDRDYNDGYGYMIWWNADRSMVATSEIGAVIIRDPLTFEYDRENYTTSIEQGGFGRVAWHPDNKHIAIGNWLGEVTLWDISAQPYEMIQVFQPAIAEGPTFPQTHIIALIISPEGEIITALRGDGNLTAWELSSGDEIMSVQLPDTVIKVADFNPDGTLLAYGTEEGELEIIPNPALTETE